MSNKIGAFALVILFAGNIYFYLQSKKNTDNSIVMGAALSKISATSPKAATFKYLSPSFEMNSEVKKIKNNLQNLKEFAKNNKCNEQYAFVVDMHIPSYKKRFFV